MDNRLSPQTGVLISVLALAGLCALLLLSSTTMQEGALAQAPTATPLVYGPKAVAMPMSTARNLSALDLNWYYNATFARPHEADARPYAYMVACNEAQTRFGTPTLTITQAAQADAVNGIRGRVWLIFNQPDDPGTDGCGQFSFYDPPVPKIIDDPVGAANRFSQIYDWIKSKDPSARVFGGGLVRLNDPHTRWWWTTFVNTLNGRGELYKLEGVHVHLYAPHLRGYGGCPGYDDAPARCAAWSANRWYQEMHVGLGLGDRPIWITEFGWLGGWGSSSAPPGSPTPTPIADVWWNVADHYMRPLGRWFTEDPAWTSKYPDIPANPGYDAMAWYCSWDTGGWTWTHLLQDGSSDSEATALGSIYWNPWPGPPQSAYLPLVMKDYTGSQGAGPQQPQPLAIPSAYPAPLQPGSTPAPSQPGTALTPRSYP